MDRIQSKIDKHKKERYSSVQGLGFLFLVPISDLVLWAL
jgi:hypothetical protein